MAAGIGPWDRPLGAAAAFLRGVIGELGALVKALGKIPSMQVSRVRGATLERPVWAKEVERSFERATRVRGGADE
jgi:hypothetical protein